MVSIVCGSRLPMTLWGVAPKFIDHAANRKFHCSWFLRISSHRPHARQWRVDHHKAGHTVAVLRDEGVADHVANVGGDECCSLELERIKNASPACVFLS